MVCQDLTISILGSCGGVAKATLAILNRSVVDLHDPLHQHMKCCKIHLVDWKQKDIEYYRSFSPNLVNQMCLHQFDLNNKETVLEHLKVTNTSLVIDVSWADTVDMIDCCNELGISYLNTALENTMVDQNENLEGFTLIERYRIFENHRSKFTNMKGILCSGMNPGVVQWMALTMLKEIPDEFPLACYIVENDNTFYRDISHLKAKTIYSSWSPECFLDEAILNYPMFITHHVPHFLYSPVYGLEFKVSLGHLQFYGCLMPHEEVLSMGRLYDMEIGFIYKVNDYTSDVIRSNLDHAEDLWNWEHKVLDPADAELAGEDLVGVLLVYKDKELFMYNVMDNQSVFSQYKTNATYFQVACGVYGAACSLLLDEIPNGLYYVDELLTKTTTDYGQYVSYYMKDFTIGKNAGSDGTLLNRMRKASKIGGE